MKSAIVDQYPKQVTSPKSCLQEFELDAESHTVVETVDRFIEEGTVTVRVKVDARYGSSKISRTPNQVGDLRAKSGRTSVGEPLLLFTLSVRENSMFLSRNEIYEIASMACELHSTLSKELLERPKKCESIE
jgi:hypothetical protein